MRPFALVAAGCLASVLAGCVAAPVAAREQAHRSNNNGVALLEQLKYAEAERAFRQALAADGSLAMATVNLSLALLYQQQLDAAAATAAEAARLLPASAQPPYIQGLVARAQGRNDLATVHFSQVRRMDPGDAITSVQLAQIALEERRYDEAIALLTPIVVSEPNHVTAAYVLGLATVRAGQPDGQRWLARAQALRDSGTGVALGTGYLEQGRHAEATSATGAEAGLVDTGPARITFAVARHGDGPGAAGPASPFGRRYLASDLDAAGVAQLVSGLGGGLTLLDADGDGDLDVFGAAAAGQRLWRNDGSAWPDTTPAAGLQDSPAGLVPVGAVSADYDNDGRADLFVLRSGGSSLYHNEGGARFRDVTRDAQLPPYPYLPGAAAFADLDHDGDLDLVVAGLADVDATRRLGGSTGRLFPQEFAPAPLQVLRNNRNGTFSDVSYETRIRRTGHASAIVPADFDNRRDVDLLIAYVDAPPALLANQRDGSFRDVTAESGLASLAGSVAVAAGDFNKDDWPDLFFATAAGGVVALSDGRGRFSMTRGPADPSAVTASQVVDYDADGLLDLLLWTGDRARVWRNLGGEWRDDSERAMPAAAAGASRVASPRQVAVADLDRDGHADVVAGGLGGFWLWRNGGDPRHHSLRVELQGLVSNKAGVGTKVQVRAGSLGSRLDLVAATPAVTPADLVFGLGPRPGADALRVLWPSGIVQAELPAASPSASAGSDTLASPLRVTELDRKPSSCPFLFTWNGERFTFVTDFLGAGEMGLWMAPSTYNRPDPVEYVRIQGDQLQPRNGRLELRVTNELEEALFLDRLQLLAIDHPPTVEVYPDEGLTDPPKPERLIAVRHLRPLVRAEDDHGHDVLTHLARLDWVSPDDFGLDSIRGYAAPHVLTIDLGRPTPNVLLLTGWTDYAFSSDNVAAHQAGLRQQPPVLEVKEATGRWRRLDPPVGIPVGRPQTVPVDLTGQLRAGERELRLSTNLRIFWDRIQAGDIVPGPSPVPRPVSLRSAELRERGYSAVLTPGPPGLELYDYNRVAGDAPWKTLAGWYTRTGDVRSLLASADDRFVIARNGDEVAVAFDAAGLDSAAAGSRTWILRAEGYSKEMDVNSASPDAVAPLPFRRMTRYPYPPSERPAAGHGDEAVHTRQVVRPVPSRWKAVR